MSRASEPSAPSIFGRPMLPMPLGESWKLELGAFTAFVRDNDSRSHHRCYAELRGYWCTFASTPKDAAAAIETRLTELVLSLAPLLDDAAKRELVKAAGIGLEHFPECKGEAESEVEPLL